MSNRTETKKCTDFQYSAKVQVLAKKVDYFLVRLGKFIDFFKDRGPIASKLTVLNDLAFEMAMLLRTKPECKFCTDAAPRPFFSLRN